MEFGCAAKAPDFRWVTPKGTQERPPGPYFALVGCVGIPKRSVPTRPPKTLTWPIETALDMQIRAKQRGVALFISALSQFYLSCTAAYRGFISVVPWLYPALTHR